MKKAFLLICMAISFALTAQQTNKPILSEVAVKTSQPANQSGWGDGSYCVFVRVQNFDSRNKSHWEAIKNYSRKYCDIYRDRYFSLYFISGSFNVDDCECEINLRDATQKELYYSRVIAEISLRSPNNPRTGKRDEKPLTLGVQYDDKRPDTQFRSICGMVDADFYPCGE